MIFEMVYVLQLCYRTQKSSNKFYKTDFLKGILYFLRCNPIFLNRLETYKKLVQYKYNHLTDTLDCLGFSMARQFKLLTS